MVDLDFRVEGVEPVAHAATPTLAFRLRVARAPGPAPGRGAGQAIQSVALACQLRLDPARRRYTPAEQARLGELFGAPRRWSQTVRPMLWTHASVTLPSFDRETLADLPVACTYDFNLAATKYFDALDAGAVPVTLLFSGTIFGLDEAGAVRVSRVPWEKEASCQLPVAAWRAMMELYYPNTAWLGLRKDLFDRLARFKAGRSLPTWERAVEDLLAAAGEVMPP